MTLQASRTQLVQGDSDRNFVYVWDRAGGLGNTYTLRPSGVGPTLVAARGQLVSGEDDTDAPYHGMFQLPDPTVIAVPSGTYVLDVGRGPELTLQIITFPTRASQTIPAGYSRPAIQAALAANKLAITLAPGEHIIDVPITLPDYTSIIMHGATARRLVSQADINAEENAPCFQVGDHVTVYGGTFLYPVPGQVFRANPGSSDLVVVDSTFKACNFGFYFANSMVRDCRFESGGGMVIAPGGLILRPYFQGPGFQDPYQYWFGQGPAAVLNAVFDKTSRGPVFNAADGTISDLLFVGTLCSNINWTPNGNEIFLCEGGEFNNLLCFHTRVTSCESALFGWNGGGTNSLISDLAVDGGAGISFDINDLAAPDATITNQTVQFFQIMKGGIYCGPSTTSCLFTDGSVIAFTPTRANQTFQNPSPVGFQRIIAAWSNGPSAGTNTLTRVSILALLPGMRPLVGFVIGS